MVEDVKIDDGLNDENRYDDDDDSDDLTFYSLIIEKYFELIAKEFEWKGTTSFGVNLPTEQEKWENGKQ